METKKSPQRSEQRGNKVLTIIGIVLCVILIPILIVNCTLLVKSFLNQEEVPDFAGYIPLIVLTDSMYPDIKSGDLIFVQKTDAEDVQEGDVISFFDPEGGGSAVVTHKVIERIEEDGRLSFRTQGINNNTADRLPVPSESLVGLYTGTRITGAGNVALFLQSTPGLFVCVLLPLAALVLYEVLHRRKQDKSKDQDIDALMKELEMLKAERAQSEAAAAEAPVGDAEDASQDEKTDA